MNNSDCPRPDRTRGRRHSLDGDWEFEFDPHDRGLRDGWQNGKGFGRTIRVPFCIESEMSGIFETGPPAVSWYGREFLRRDLGEGTRHFINFGAVDYEAQAWLNGAHLGSHRGGYTPFSFEITNHLEDSNRLVLRVQDRRRWGTLRGKQYVYRRLSPVFYTPASGIWQPVYLYATGDAHIASLRIAVDGDMVRISWGIDASRQCTMLVRIYDPGGAMVSGHTVISPHCETGACCTIKNPAPWAPEHPHCYSARITLHDDRGVSDEVTSTIGFRRIEAREGRIYLNGDPIFLKMALVQGYYPGGHYTPVDGLAGYERDILSIKHMGFNGIRMHQKIEDPRFLHLCDRHGLLVWEEMPSPFLFGSIDESQYETELADALTRDAHHPCLMAMVLFNETWGIYDLLWSRTRRRYVRDLYRRVKENHPDLLLVDNSGFDHVITDIADIHHYLPDDAAIRRLYDSLGYRDRMHSRGPGLLRSLAYLLWTHRVAKKPYLRDGEYRGFEPFVVSEFGGADFYRSGKSILQGFEDNVRIMAGYPSVAGYCLTQAFDVEGERNGLLTSDRTPKYPLEDIAAVNRIIS